MKPEKWERIARLLKAEYISNREAAARLGVGKEAVAEVRSDLGLPRFVLRRTWTREEFEALAPLIRGGHRLWRGRRSPDGTPVAGQNVTAYRVSFRLHHQREPVGHVKTACTRKWCVEGSHLADDLLRTAAVVDAATLPELPAEATWRGMDIVAIRRCLRGPEPWPALTLAEARFAFRFSNPDMGAAELGSRLGLRAETIQRYRTKGVPS
ncbi:hypothetical protein [Streptomyces sp. Root369]|uniref:hypothetical protein n=1 Tax=Streptomyces sp. Root369 TaxID=1736523 RepID=UPI00070DBA91|nr:hypothetical protein [Streptomyces sp. Root369]KQW13588.1 hypothetical protein ASD08_30970 [Streptomyces sp. Root369]